MMNNHACGLATLILLLALPLAAQNQSPNATAEKPSFIARGIDYLFNYLNMAGTESQQTLEFVAGRRNFHPSHARTEVSLVCQLQITNSLSRRRKGDWVFEPEFKQRFARH
jgi:hypothetical protein